MINVGTLEGTLSLRDQFTKVLTTARKEVSAFASQFTTAMDKARRDSAAFSKQMEETGERFTSSGRALLGFSAMAAGAVVGVAKVTMDFESSFAGVRKTVNGTAEELQALSDGFREMAREIPVSVNELHGIGQAAGQLGIAKENILGFTRVMADLGVATNLTSEEAATSLARLANITRMNQNEFDKLGSTIVDLGNNFATTEAEIVAMSVRIAGAGNQLGMSEHQIMAIGTALSSLGIEAEAGGSAISKVMIDMAANVSTGGENLKHFAKVAGQTSEEFTLAFNTDAAGALDAFIQGLGRMKDSGGDVLGLLAEMGIEEVRMRDALLRASGAGDLLTRALDRGARAWQDNTALAKEAEERYKTLESQVSILWNRIKDLGIEIGLSLLPTVKDLMKELEPLLGYLDEGARKFAQWPEWARKTAAALTILVGVLAPTLLLMGAFAASISALAAVGVTGATLLAFAKAAGIAVAALAAVYASFQLVKGGIDDAIFGLQQWYNLLSGKKMQTTRIADIDLPDPGARGDVIYDTSRPAMDIDAEIKRGNALTKALEQRLGLLEGGARRTGEMSEATKKALQAQTQALEAADKAAGDMYARFTNSDVLGEASLMVDAFRQIGDTAKIPRETLVEVAETMHEAIIASNRLGEEAPQAFYDVRDAARAATFDLKNFAGTIGIDGVELMQKMRESVNDATESYRDLQDELQDAKWANIIGMQTNEVTRAFMTLSVEHEKAMRRFRDNRPQGEAGKAWDALEKEIRTGYLQEMAKVILSTKEFQLVLEAVNRVAPGMGLIPFLLEQIKGKTPPIVKDFKTWNQSLEDLAGAFRDLAQTAEGGLSDVAQAIGTVISAMQLANKAGETLKSGWSQLQAGGMKNMAAGMTQLAAGVASAVAAMNQATSSTSKLQNVMSGAATGAQIGMATGNPWIIAGGAIVGGLIGLFRKSGAEKQKELEAVRAKEEALRKETERLQAIYDKLYTELNADFSVLLRRADDLGIRLPDAIIKSIQEMVTLGQVTEENIDLIAQLADAAEVDWRKMEEAAERYGIKTDALGQVFQQLKIDDAAAQIINDFDLLTRGGANAGAVLAGMSDEISALVRQAIQFGVTLPENMKPWIDELMKAGMLVDENGEALTDLAGLNFGDPITTAFEEITAAIEDLVEVIRTDLINALKAIPGYVPVVGDANWRPPSNTPAPEFAGGTMAYGKWFGNFGAGTQAVLHNEEAVVTRAQAPAFAADVLGLTASQGRSSGGTLPVNMIIGNRTVFAEIVMEDMDSDLGLKGIRS